MFKAISNSFHLAKESFTVLRQDLELLLLTAASFIGVAIVAVAAGGLGISSGAIDPQSEQALSTSGFILVALAYFLGYFIIIYFQVALVASVQLRMSGGDPNVWYGLARANHRLGAILSWTLIAGTVGLILRILEGAARRTRGPQAIVAVIILSLLGTAWSLLVFFVIPIIAAEGVGGVEAIRRSKNVIRKRWGEAIVGNAGMGIFFFVLMLVAAGIPLLIGVMKLPEAGQGSMVVSGVFISLGVAIALFVMVFSASMNSTYRAVLYTYTNTGEVRGFSKETLDRAFTPKNDLRTVSH